MDFPAHGLLQACEHSKIEFNRNRCNLSRRAGSERVDPQCRGLQERRRRADLNRNVDSVHWRRQCDFADRRHGVLVKRYIDPWRNACREGP
ncbi:MAG TPA: hypothetical protein VN715_06300 [Roseiarcus sp.]|nr:hypothetical protein [Roseiarcus sp.]